MKRFLVASTLAAVVACAPDDGSIETTHVDAVQTVRQSLLGGCREATFDGHAYRFCDSLKSWASARADCLAEGMDLSRIDYAAENAFVVANAGNGAWIGASDQGVEGAWTWSADATQFSLGNQTISGFFSNWKAGEPNNFFNEDCTSLDLSGKWSDTQCFAGKPYVCESVSDQCADDITKTQPGMCDCGAPETDADSDGAPDCVDECPADPETVVEGQCGCPSMPASASTACTDSVCGGASLCDGAGVCGSPSSCAPDSNCAFDRQGTSEYWFCGNLRNFDDARGRCVSVGMDLVAVESTREDSFIANRTFFPAWIGATDRDASGKWSWNGTNQTFWDDGNPTNGAYNNWLIPPSFIGDCAFKDPAVGRWGNAPCNLAKAFMCERTGDWFIVDPSVVPIEPTDPDPVSGEDRPISALVTEDGYQTNFLATEMTIEVHDPATLDAFVNRYGIGVVDTIDFEADPDPDDDLGLIHAVRIDPAKMADPGTLSANLNEIDPEYDPETYRVSDAVGLGLLATWAEATVAGYDVDVPWLAQDNQSIPLRDLVDRQLADDANAPGSRDWTIGSGPPWSANAFDWTHFGAGSVQDIGVPEAWELLARAGKMSPSIRMAVIDHSFVDPEAGPNDYPPEPVFVTAGPTIDSFDTSSRSGTSPYHGQKAAYTAWGRPNNQFGGAGPAAPVLEKAFHTTFGNSLLSFRKIARALRYLHRTQDVDIVSISSSVRAPGRIFVARRLQRVARRLSRHKGVLIVSSASNDDKDVDHKKRVRERGHWIPCEVPEVFCVGAMDHDSKEKKGDSNWGNKDVDMWGPGLVVVGPTPDCGSCTSQTFTGTSAATPFVAGVMAMVWAADPSMSREDVIDVVVDTSHKHEGSRVRRSINALAAVDAVLRASSGPNLTILEPENGAEISYQDSVIGRAVTFDADLGVPEVTWRVNGREDVRGLGINTILSRDSFRVGDNTLSATATYGDGTSVSDSVSVFRNLPGALRVTTPFDGQCIMRGAETAFKTLPPDPDVAWFLDSNIFVLGGEVREVVPLSTPLGAHGLLAQLTDGIDTDTDTINTTIVREGSFVAARVEVLPNGGQPGETLSLAAVVTEDPDGDGVYQNPSSLVPRWIIERADGTLVTTAIGNPVSVTFNDTGFYEVRAVVSAEVNEPGSDPFMCDIASGSATLTVAVVPI